MFGSLSSCAPNSQVTLEFTSDRRQKFDIWSNVYIEVNRISVATRPILLANGDIVSATVTTPSGYLGYQFYPYELDNRVHYVALVNKNNYNPTVKIADRQRRWYNYIQFRPRVSVAGLPEYLQNDLIGSSKGIVDVEKIHVIMDPLNSSAVFYSTNNNVVHRAKLPAGPIDYKKITSFNTQSGYRQDLLLLGNDGRIYRITFDSRYYESNKFEPTVTPSVILDDLPFQEDIPGTGSFMDAARKKFLSALFPAVTAMSVKANNIWLAGAETIYVLRINYSLQTIITVPGEEILDITCVNNDAVVVTKTQKVIYVGINGSSNVLFTGAAIGSPAALADGARVAVPDSNNQRLLIFNGNNPVYSIWNTPEFVPAYCRVFDGYLYVTGHNTNRVLQYYQDNDYNTIVFSNKVTLVSAVGGSIIASDHLGPAVTLNMPGIEKIIPFELEPRTGPVGYIGTEIKQLTMLGREGIYPKVPPDLLYWANGLTDVPVNSGDYFTVSYKAGFNGTARLPVILGENALDYTVTVVSSTFLQDYYLPNTVALNRIKPVFGFYPGPDSGTIDEGFTGPIPIGFNLKTFDNIYSNIYVHTNGVISFVNSPLQQDPVFGSFPIDVIYAEPKNLYQGLPILNVDPLNIITGNLDSYETPGVYFKDQILGEFAGFRIRWVGTSWDSYPLGNTVSTVVTTVNWPDIVLPNLANVRVGDYISGNNISVSSSVVATQFFNVNAAVYYAETSSNYMLLLSNIAIKRYANVIVAGTQVGFVDSSSSQQILGNSVLDVRANVLTIDGITNGNVSNDWVFVTTTSTAPAQSITRTHYSVTSLANSSGNTVRISSADYNSIYVAQTLSSSGALITGKITRPRVYSLTANCSSLVEGNTVQFTLSATEIPLSNGEIFNYTLGGTTDSADFIAGTAQSGSIIVNSGVATLDLTTEANVGFEGSETIIVTVNLESGLLISRTVILLDDGIPNNTPVTGTVNSLNYFNYYFTSNANITAIAGTGIAVAKTEIDFGSMAAPPATGSIRYQYHRVNIFGGPGATISSNTIVNFSGNFATVTNNQTLTANTAVLFKSNSPTVPAYTYEVGFYTGGRFQYIELFYDNNRHNPSTLIGITGVDTVNDRANATVAANSSYLFGSETIDGRWIPLGRGSFTKDSQGFVPRYVDLIKSVGDLDNENAYEFIVDQKIPTTSNIKLAIDYGKIYLNSRIYTGLDNLLSGDRVKITVPLGTNQTPIAPMFAIGDYQQVIAVVKDSEAFRYSTIANVYIEQPFNNYLRSNIDITVSGTYTIPGYFRSTDALSGISQTFIRLSGGLSTVLSGRYHNLVAGDRIMITNQLTSTRYYDTREIVIVGPVWHVNKLITPTGSRFNDMTFLPLNSPFVRLTTMNQDGTRIFEDPAYRTANLTLTATVPVLSGNLLVDRFGVNLVVNGTTIGPYVGSVGTGAKIALEWMVPNYFQQDAVIYQIKTDIDGGNVRIPMGFWSINNRSILGASVNSNLSIISKSLTGSLTSVNLLTKNFSQTIDRAASKLVGSINSQFVGQNSRFGNIINSFLTNIGSYINKGAITSKNENTITRVGGLISAANTAVKYSIFNVGAITGRGLDNPFSDVRSQSARGNILVSGAFLHNDSIVGNILTRPNNDIRGNVGQGQVDGRYSQLSDSINSQAMTAITESQNKFDETELILSATTGQGLIKSIYDNAQTVFSSNMHSLVYTYDVIEGNIAPKKDYVINELLDILDSKVTEQTLPLEKIFESRIQDQTLPLEKIFESRIQDQTLPLKKILESRIQDQTRLIEHLLQSSLPTVKPEVIKIFSPELRSQQEKIYQSMEPVFLIKTQILKSFVPEIMPLASQLRIFVQPSHYQDLLWEMTNYTDVGAVYSYIGAFADDGREGDNVTSRGNPKWRGPFVFHEHTYLYNKGSYSQQYIAAFFAAKYVSATAFQIFGTNYWNYRIHFNTRILFKPRTGYVWPSEWLVRGG